MYITKELGIAAAILVSIVAFSSTMADAMPLISRTKAIEKANKKFSGLILKLDLENRDSIPVYEINILDANDNIHRITVNAIYGEIMDHSAQSIDKEKAAILNSAEISYSDIEKISMKKQKYSKLILKNRLTILNGKPIYDLHLIDKNGKRYEFTMDALTGDVIYHRQTYSVASKVNISPAKAEKNALEAVKGNVIYNEITYKNAATIYSITILSKEFRLYEVDVDAITGKVMQIETDD